MSDASAYWQGAAREIPRFLSWQDREELSRTFGSFDRTYWGWKFTDFPGARFQEGVYALAHLFARPCSGNYLAGDERVLEWVQAGIRFWQKIQYADGSFDEAYPFERSFAATAFTSFYIGEASCLLGEALSTADRCRVRSVSARAGDWLCRNDERHGLLSNHLAAAAAALAIIARICEDGKYAKRSQYFLRRILDHQSPEGWYEEYGGADPGYQTHGTFYLARLWQHTQDQELLESLERSLVFLKHFFHPDRTLGGEYGSRNTEFYFPAGFEILSRVLPDAALIAGFMRPSIGAGSAVGLPAMDAYNFFPMYNNYLFAFDHAEELRDVGGRLPCEEEMECYFPDAGLFVKSTSAYFAILGLSKGGVLRLYSRLDGKLAATDCGYWANTAAHQIISSQTLRRPGTWRRDVDTFIVETTFVEVVQQRQTPWLFVVFRAFSITLGRVKRVAYWLKNQLVARLVRPGRGVPLRLARTVRFESDQLVVQDRLQLSNGLRLLRLESGAKFTTIHMGSSKYFQPQELTAITSDAPHDLAADLSQNRSLMREQVLRIPH